MSGEPRRVRVAVVGAGYTGLVAAYRLACRGHEVELLERGHDAGGLAGDFRMHGACVEKSYHVVVPTDDYLVALIEELGLGSRLAWPHSRVCFFHGSRIYPFNGPVDLLRFSPLPVLDRLRVGLTIAVLQRTKRTWRKFDRVTAATWMRRHAGDAAYEVMWAPLLRGKFDRFHDRVSMQWLWGRIKQRVDIRRPGVGGETLGVLAGGYHVLTQELLRRLADAGVVTRYGTEVQELRWDPASRKVRAALGQGAGATGSASYDKVVVTGPSPVFARMIEGASEATPDQLALLRAVPYLGAVSLVFSSTQVISDYFWHNISAPAWPFLVFINLTCLRDPAEFGGRQIYYIASYVDHDDPMFGEPEDALVGRWFDALARMFPAFDRSRVEERALFRMRYAQHVVEPGYAQRIPPYRSAVPGVYLANFSQIYPQDRGTNFSIREGDRIARLVDDDVATGGWPARR